MKGILLNCEGIEGAGKSSVIKHLARYLRFFGVDVVVTREPGGTPLAEEIRKALLWGQTDNEVMHPDTELLLVYASRAQHYRTLVKPALERGCLVLTDRWADSSRCLQSEAGVVPLDRWNIINDYVLDGFKPDMTLLFDLPVSVGAARAKNRGKLDYFEKKGPEFHERVRAGYLQIAKEEPGRFRMIDADRPRKHVREQVKALIPEILRLYRGE